MAGVARERGVARGGACVSTELGSGLGARVVQDAVAHRLDAGERFFGAEAERIARLCHRTAERFARGGRLVALAASPAGRSDARHVAVEFVHPVIVGKRALPAIGLAGEGGPVAQQVDLVAEPDDIAIAFGPRTRAETTWRPPSRSPARAAV